MNRIWGILLILAILFIISSCFKEDEQISPHPTGDLKTDTIPMSQNYKYQVYFDLGSGTITSKNIRTNSDLGFECSEGGWKIILNTADFMKVADLGKVPFGEKQDTVSKKWIFDKSDGNPDSLAIGQWFVIKNEDTVSNDHVYAIDRGVNEDGTKLGLYQVIFDSLSGGKYYFRFTEINGGSIYSGIVPKDSTRNYQWFSLDAGGSIKPDEPQRTSYDLLFTQYTTMLYTDLGEPYPYLVTGVLINRYKMNVGIDTVHAFSDINLSDAKQVPLSTALDKIGYEWKYYSFETGAYTMRTDIAYVIRNAKGFYYKLRFIGFYNSKGEKGYPVIEYQAL